MNGTAIGTVVGGGAQNTINPLITGGIEAAYEVVGLTGSSIDPVVYGNEIVDGFVSGAQVYGYEDVSGSAVSGVLYSGATDLIEAGGTARGTVIENGGEQSVSGTTSGAVLQTGGVLYVNAGGSLIGAFVQSGGSAYIESGGLASGVSVQSGGVLNVANGAVMSGDTVSSGGFCDILALTVANGQNVTVAVPGVVLLSGAAESAGLITVDPQASATLTSGVQAPVYVWEDGAVVGPGGLVGSSFVMGDISSVSLLSSGTLQIYALATGENITVVDGAMTIDNNGKASGVTVLDGSVTVSSGGSLSNTVLSSTTPALKSTDVFGAATSTTIGFDGEQIVESGGSASASVVQSGGFEVVSAGGYETGDTVLNGGMDVVVAGAGLTRVVVNSGGAAFFEQVVSRGQVYVAKAVTGTTVISGATLSSGAFEDVVYTDVLSGATLSLTSSAAGLEVAIEVGGHLVGGGTLLSENIAGGTVSGVTLGNAAIAGGLEVVEYGSAMSVTVSDGELRVDSGGLADYALLIGVAGEAPSAEEDVFGFAYGTQVEAGGEQIVEAQGIAHNTTVRSGGLEVISNGGMVDSVTVDSGGALVADGGAVLSDVLLQSGAIVELPGVSAATSAYFNGGDELVVMNGTVTVDTLVVGVEPGVYGFKIVPGGQYGLELVAGVAQSAVQDYRGDDHSDFLIQNTNGGVVAGELGSNGQVAWSQIGGLGPEWRFDGSGDFLADGKSQFLIENANGGAVDIAEVGSNGATNYTQIGALGPEWKFVATGDFYGTGASDFLIDNSNGSIDVGVIGTGGQASYTQIGGLGPEWKFVGAGDFLNEGKDQFLLENTNGAVVVGQIYANSGQAIYTQVGALGPEWTFEGVGDFLGRGNDQMLLENTNGAVVVGGIFSNNQIFYTQIAALGPDWKFVGVGDYTGDGLTSFALENASGALVTGTVVNGKAQYAQVGGLGTAWSFKS